MQQPHSQLCRVVVRTEVEDLLHFLHFIVATYEPISGISEYVCNCELSVVLYTNVPKFDQSVVTNTN